MGKYHIGPAQIGASEDGVELTDFTQDIDLFARFGQAVRAVEIVTATSGTLVVETPGSASESTPTTRTFTGLASGAYLGGRNGLQVNKIIATGTSGITKIWVWL